MESQPHQPHHGFAATAPCTYHATTDYASSSVDVNWQQLILKLTCTNQTGYKFLDTLRSASAVSGLSACFRMRQFLLQVDKPRYVYFALRFAYCSNLTGNSSKSRLLFDQDVSASDCVCLESDSQRVGYFLDATCLDTCILILYPLIAMSSHVIYGKVDYRPVTNGAYYCHSCFQCVFVIVREQSSGYAMFTCVEKLVCRTSRIY
jgi:hypothetical protein